MSMGGMAFAMANQTDPTKLRYIPPVVVEILEQAGLLDTTIGIDPMKSKPKKEDNKGYKYRRWGITALDESLFVSDGTTEDGGRVGLKISDQYQAIIENVSNVGRVENHLVYKHTYGTDTFGKNALIPMSYLEDLFLTYLLLGNH